MQSWIGLDTTQAFSGWRHVVQTVRRQRRREGRSQLREERIKFEDAVARYEYQRIDVGEVHSFFFFLCLAFCKILVLGIDLVLSVE